MKINMKKADKIVIHGSKELYQIMTLVLKRERAVDRSQEHFWTLSLTSSHTLLNLELVSLGSSNKAIGRPADVFSIPLQKKAESLILVHNHPSGNLEPSEEDQQLTDRLIQVGMFMNIPILDHMIITEKSYYSFFDSGLLQSLKDHPNARIHAQNPPLSLKEEGISRAVLSVLHARGLKVSDNQKKKILSCTDLTTLDRWIRKAVEVKNVQEMFG